MIPNSNPHFLSLMKLLEKGQHLVLILGVLFALILGFPKGSAVWAQEEEDEKGGKNQQESGETEEEEKSVEVVIGIDKIIILDFAPSTKVQVGNETFLNYQLIPQKREITLKGLRAGETSLTIRNSMGDVKARYRVKITSNSKSQVVSELREFLDDVEGLEIGIKGGRVYVGGEIVVPKDIGRVHTVLQNYKDIVTLYELSPHTQRVVARKMQEEAHKLGLKDVTYRVVNGVFWIEGAVTKESDRELAMKIAEGYMPDKLEDLSAQANRVQQVKGRAFIQNFVVVNAEKSKPPPPPKMIKIIAQFVELTKDYGRIFGFKWTPSLATGGGSIQFGKTVADGVTSRSNGTFSGTISNLFPKLAAAKSAGYARVIQSGIVIVKDKGEATINKKSTTPFVLGTGEFQKAAAVETGFNLTVNTAINGTDKVELGVNIGVNMVQGENGNTNNSIKTSLLVKSAETAVVGGISVNESSTNFDKDPPFGTDKVEGEGAGPLFSFLRSKQYSISKSQFVVFITPEIVETAASITEEVKKKFRQRGR